MVSWSVGRTSKRQENRQKKPRFRPRNSEPLFAYTPAPFRENKKLTPPSPFCVAHAPTKRHFCFKRRFSRLSSFQEKRKPSDGSQRKNAEARSGTPLVWGYRSPERASALSYFQSLKMSFIASSTATPNIFSMKAKASFSKMDCSRFLSFLSFCFRLWVCLNAE